MIFFLLLKFNVDYFLVKNNNLIKFDEKFIYIMNVVYWWRFWIYGKMENNDNENNEI